MDRPRQERNAENDSLFRDANERIRDVAEEYGVMMRIPFICECPDPRCTEIVRLELPEYRAVREHPRRFVNAPGHDAAAGSAVRVVSAHEAYVVVEKVGHAGDAEERLVGGMGALAAERDRGE